MIHEVNLMRFAGPFTTVPFKHFIQSPVGLVEKKPGNQTRPIFHLNHPRNPPEGVPRSVNHYIPDELSTVKHRDLDHTVKMCAYIGSMGFLAKSDMKSALRHLPIHPQDWPLLVMMARNSADNKKYYFFDKNLPFGSKISCSHFQRVSYQIMQLSSCMLTEQIEMQQTT